MKYKLTIPEPCNENWNVMTATQKGRFCDVCVKEIYDLTKLSNYQLAKKLDNNKKFVPSLAKNNLTLY